MCKSFSCIITKDKKVYWKLGMDNHHNLVEEFKLTDNTSDENKMKIARIEITPKNNNYLYPDEWNLQVDERIRPIWFSPAHEDECFKSHKIWLQELNKHLNKKPIIHPFKDVETPNRITKKHIKLIKKWDSVGYSVGDSVGYSVGDSVWDSVGYSVVDSVGDSVWDSVGYSVWDSVGYSVGYSVVDSVGYSVGDSVGYSVGDSVRDSVYGYIGSFFNLDNWKNIEHKKGEHPFKSVADLWEMGLVPSFDGNIWRLHGGKKGEVLFEITKEDLMEQ